MSEPIHAALLIDFDNVTMGMRSDLSKELKSLLASDVIKGKVSVQRAYADWRRYPQYIVPLSEASVDLIFAPAYGSSKKNATDIRMAIDALELVFVRPEIGTFILLTGDSDFSSLVLKLKEYGKYVIGVGIQESTSDILVQNCDEYYSYTSLSGLRKTTEAGTGRPADPWVLVKEALKRMVDRGDVMRSDRLKQVMQEIDPTFDEGGHGFSKFSKFLAEASSRGAVSLQKLDNGQYEVSVPRGSRSRREDGEERESRRDRGRGRGERRERDAHEQRPSRAEAPEVASVEEAPAAPSEAPEADRPEDPLRAGYALLTRALTELKESGKDPVRDSDVKRKMLDLDARFDETELGFPKFSKFLGQAEDHGVVRLVRNEAGNFEVTLDGAGQPKKGGRDGHGRRRGRREEPSLFEHIGDAPEATPDAGPRDTGGRDEGARAPETSPVRPTVVEIDPAELGDGGLRLGPRRGSTRRRGDEGIVLLPGQAVTVGGEVRAESGRGRKAEAGPAAEPVAKPAGEPVAEPAADAPAASGFSAADLGLPTEPAAIVRYLTHRYRGVGEKTAESLVERFGVDLFRVLNDDPQAINDAVTPKRAEQVLEAWKIDYERRAARRSGSGGEPAQDARGGERPERGERGGRRGGRRRGPRGRGES